jgi:hypothetical protein
MDEKIDSPIQLVGHPGAPDKCLAANRAILATGDGARQAVEQVQRVSRFAVSPNLICL